MEERTSKKLGMDDQENYEVSPLLDLPEFALECILERLSPDELFTMAGVCGCLRQKCKSNRLWERHMKQKWRNLLGSVAYRAWLTFVDSGNINSVMHFYFALETGKFWFPAQVYYTENWHVSFVMSCYDAELSYDSRSDKFQARYPPHGRRRGVEIEHGIEWERVRAPPLDTSPHELYIPECLHDLLPGDHVEVQWRRNKESPFGWWYGVVGHLETCNVNENHCHCHNSDIVVLEFKQYAPGSRWRRASVSRECREEGGNRATGFYGGIRKLYIDKEIAEWERFWPQHIME